MKRTEKDVAYSDLGQVTRCLWCGEHAMHDGEGGYICFNDPECTTAKEAEGADETEDCAPEGLASIEIAA